MGLLRDQFEDLFQPLDELIERFQVSVLEDIARRIARMGKVSAASAWQAQRLIESGMTFSETMRKIANLTRHSEAEMAKLFREAGVAGIRLDEKIYREAGLDPLPFHASLAAQNVLAAGLAQTHGDFRNLALSAASAGQNAFLDGADLAHMQITSGAMSYQQAVREAVLDVARQGLTAVRYDSGRRDQLDVAMARSVRTGVNHTVAELQMTLAHRMGTDLVEVSAHTGARNKGTGAANHASWQGKVYSITGKHPRYPSLRDVTGYGTAVGLLGINCRHDIYPFFEGASERNYTDKELDELEGRTVALGGEEVPFYEATQAQRKLEREIRLRKREAACVGAAGLDNGAELAAVRAAQGRLRAFIDETGLDRQGWREGGRARRRGQSASGNSLKS